MVQIMYFWLSEAIFDASHVLLILYPPPASLSKGVQ